MSTEAPKFSFYDQNNMLVIVVDLAVFLFDGKKWESFPINDINLPGTDFNILKRSSIVEIFQTKDSQYSKVLLISGGYNFQTKSASKQNFILNFFHDSAKKETKCLLDFKFRDMEKGRFLHNATNILNKYIVIIGGKNEKEYLNSCECLSIEEKKWYPFPQLPSSRANFSICVANSNMIYLYGGYESNGKFNSDKLCYCNFDVNDFSKSKWENIKIKVDDPKILPGACCNMVPYEENIIITGGTNGEHLLDGIFELKISEKENNEISIDNLGKTKTARNNAHILMRDGDFFLVGGAIKEYKFNENKTAIENYCEKFTFDLNNEIESTLISVNSADIIEPLNSFNINASQYKNEPGFPYNCSLLTKQFS